MDEILISILVIFITLGISYFFKFRIRPIALVGNEMQFVDRIEENIRNQQPIQNLSMRAQAVPFACTLHEGKSSINDGVSFSVKLSELGFSSFNVLLAWAVEIDKFYTYLEKPFADALFNPDEMFLSSCSKSVMLERVTDVENLTEKEFKFERPSVCGDLFEQLEKDTVIRKHYQLVVALYRDQNQLESLRPGDVVANVYVLHLRDKKLNSKIVYNYLKLANNQLTSLTPVFNTDVEGLCVVCRTTPVNIIVLPCNHKCLCLECLSRVSRKCPICRSTITQKFDM